MQIQDGSSQVSDEMHELISNYIINKYAKVYVNTEKQFEVHKVYGTSESNGTIRVYMYSYFGGFNKSTGLESIGGHSLPAVIELKKSETGYKVIAYTEPQDGNLYQSSLKRMFPAKYLEKAYRDTGHIPDLLKEMDDKVMQWLELPK